MIHDLKVSPKFWEALESGRKNFEVRYAGDRNFVVGDVLHLREWDSSVKTSEGERWRKDIGYTGREVYREITYILSGVEWGLRHDYVVLALI